MTMEMNEAIKNEDRELAKELSTLGASPNEASFSSNSLLELPGELRNEIYLWVLGSTRITFAEDWKRNRGWDIWPIVNHSPPHPLALLYTCRQIQREIGSNWISWILFNFATAESMLSFLTVIPPAQIAAIRHIRVSGCPALLQLVQTVWHYTLAWTMKLLPDLRLDTLTVIGFGGNGPPELEYHVVDQLVTHGAGWKELHYITPVSDLLSFGVLNYGRIYQRRPQPADWAHVLGQRDGPESGSSVTIYRSTSSIKGSVVNQDEREIFEQDAVSLDPTKFGKKIDEVLRTPEERNKGVLIVIKRGENANITENITEDLTNALNPSPAQRIDFPFYRHEDLRAWNRSWNEIKDELWRCDEKVRADIECRPVRHILDGNVYEHDEDPEEEEKSRSMAVENFFLVRCRVPSTIVEPDTYGCDAHAINWKEVKLRWTSKDWYGHWWPHYVDRPSEI